MSDNLTWLREQAEAVRRDVPEDPMGSVFVAIVDEVEAARSLFEEATLLMPADSEVTYEEARARTDAALAAAREGA